MQSVQFQKTGHNQNLGPIEINAVLKYLKSDITLAELEYKMLCIPKQTTVTFLPALYLRVNKLSLNNA